MAAIAAALADAQENRATAGALGTIPSGFRNIPSGYQSKTYASGDEEIVVRYRITRGVVDLPDDEGVEVVDGRLIVDGVAREYTVSRYGDTVFADRPGRRWRWVWRALRRPVVGAAARVATGADARLGHPSCRRAGRPRDRGPAAAVVGGHEDGATRSPHRVMASSPRWPSRWAASSPSAMCWPSSKAEDASADA